MRSVPSLVAPTVEGHLCLRAEWDRIMVEVLCEEDPCTVQLRTRRRFLPLERRGSVMAYVLSRVQPFCNHSPLGSSVHGILQARMLEWVAMPSFRVIFLTQGSYLSLLHCRQILYHLNHKRSPSICVESIYKGQIM